MVSSRFPLKPIHHYNDCFHLNFMVFYGHLISRPWHDRHHGTTAGVPHSHVPWFVKIMVSWFPRKWTRWNHRKRSGKKTRTWYFNAAQWTILTYIVDNGMGFCGQFSRCFWHMTWDLCFNVALDFFTHAMGVMRRPSRMVFSIYFFYDRWLMTWDFLIKFDKNLGTSGRILFFLPAETCFELLSRVRWGRFGKLEMKHGEEFGLPIIPKNGMELKLV